MDVSNLKNADEVKKWIKKFKSVMSKCPSNLWFFNTGQCNIMVAGDDGLPVYTNTGGYDPDFCIDTISANYLFEGGDW